MGVEIKEINVSKERGFWTNKLAIIRKSEFVIPLTILFGIFLLLLVSAYENNSDNSSILDGLNNSNLSVNDTINNSTIELNQTIGDNNSGARKSVSDEVQTAKLNYGIQDFGGQTFYWVGANNGNWNNSASWATSSGGAGGVGVPNNTVAVVFDSANLNNSIIDANFSGAVYSLNISKGYSGTITSNLGWNKSLNVTADLIISNGTLTHTANGGSEVYRLNVLAGNITLEPAGKINVSGKGYAPGNGPGTPLIGSYGSSSYGGRGGYTSNGGGISGNTYGSITNPVNLGSGSHADQGSAGGGAVILNVSGNVNISGGIFSNGGPPAQYSAGSGGSIYLIANAFVGSGVLNAHGVYSPWGSGMGSGGGGRIAVYTSGNDFGNVSITTYGGSGPAGAAGTVYLKRAVDAYGQLIIDNNGMSSGVNTWIHENITGTPNFKEIIVKNSARLQLSNNNLTTNGTLTINNSGYMQIDTNSKLNLTGGTLTGDNNNAQLNLNGGEVYTSADFNYTNIHFWLSNASSIFNPSSSFTIGNGALFTADTMAGHTFSGNVIIKSGATVTHSANGGSEVYKLNLTILGNLTIETGGNISVIGKGYAQGNGPGAPTIGLYAGGSYGGRGGNGVNWDGISGTTYGSIINPVSLGSGSHGQSGSSGGGAVILNVSGYTNINGSIFAIGGPSGGYSAGSGGTIYLVTNTFGGNGSLNANGAVEAYGGGSGGMGSGGGGRIAVYTSGNDFGNVSIGAFGGAGYHQGAAGTVYLKRAVDAYGQLIIDNNGMSSGVNTWIHENITGTPNFKEIIVKNSARLQLSNNNLTTNGTLTINNSGYMQIDTNSKLNLTGGTLTGDNNNAQLNLNGGEVYTSADFNYTNIHFWLSNASSIFNPSSSFTIGNGALFTADTMAGHTFSGNVIIKSGATVTHSANGGSEVYKLNLTILGNLTIETGGNISVIGKGYAQGNGPGAPTIGLYAGGSYGGRGGNGVNWDGISGTTYGSIINPVSLGSGSHGQSGSSGGGAVILNVSGYTNINGSIFAIGGPSGGYSAGSGGTIYLVTNTFGGNGSLNANGAVEAYGGGSGGMGSGGGGRIAVYTSGNDFGNVSIGAFGGAGYHQGAAGTVYLKRAVDAYGQLIIDNNGMSSGVNTWIHENITGTPNFKEIIVKNSARLQLSNNNLTTNGTLTINNSGYMQIDTNSKLNLTGGTLTGDNNNAQLNLNGGEVYTSADFNYTNIHFWLSNASSIFNPSSSFTIGNGALFTADTMAGHTFSGNVIIKSGATVTHSANGGSEVYKLNLTILGNLTIETGGNISVIGKGYAQGNGPGAPTIGLYAGGSYGGRGGNGVNWDGISGTTYGSIINPVSLGSGSHGQSGSSGGGAVILNVSGYTNINGSIFAIGGPSGGYSAGSGGTIYLVTNTFGGNGSLNANGAVEAYGGGSGGMGSGGGGRIAVYTSGNDFGNVSIGAFGGAGYHQGAAGTVYLKRAVDAYGQLIIDNNGVSTSSLTLISPNVTDTIVGNMELRNYTRFYINGTQRFNITGNITVPVSSYFTGDAGSTVYITPTGTSYVVGNLSLGNLQIIGVGKSVKFAASNLTASNVTFTGSPGSFLILTSTNSINWTIGYTGSANVSYVDASYSTNYGQLINTSNSMSSYGNLYGWNVFPNATLLTPVNNTYTNSSAYNFTGNFSDSLGLGSANLSIYNSTGLVNQSTANFAQGTVGAVVGVVNNLLDGIYNWFWNIFDIRGNQIITENRTLIVDLTAPSLNFVSPTNANATPLASASFLSNVTISDLYLRDISWTFNGTSFSYGTSSFLRTPANLTQGLVMLMNFDNETSYGENATKIVDFSGNGNNGAVYGGAVWNSSGKYGGGMTFDGVDDNLTIMNATRYFIIGNASGGNITYSGGYTIHTFNYTGADQIFSAGSNFDIVVKIWGAGGGGGYNAGWGGGGGYTTGNFSVTSGQQYMVVVGRGGSAIVASGGTGPIVYGGGGQTTGGWGGQGGGLSGLFSGSSPITFNGSTSSQSRALFIAGGGGGGGWENTQGGAGGGLSGTNGQDGTDLGGRGGNQTSGGSGKFSPQSYGSALQGGAVYGDDTGGGGAGGGGYYGGGAGANTGTGSGGGGGSGFVISNGNTTAGNATSPGNSGDSDRGTAGTGGTGSSGGNNGTVIIKYLTLVDTTSSSLWIKPTSTNTWEQVAYNGTAFFKNGVVGSPTFYPLNGLNVGINRTGGTYFNGTIDEVMVWNRSLSTTEISQLYQSQVKKYVDTNVTYFNFVPSANTSAKISSSDGINWNMLVNQTGLETGNGYIYYASASDIVNNIGSTDRRTIRGNRAPTLTSISYSSVLDDLDPGAEFAVSVNISEIDNNFESAMIQWKNQTGIFGEHNVTLNNITSKSLFTILNGSFTLPLYENNISFRIWANDSLGFVFVSSNYTIQSFWDCSWNVSSELDPVAGWDQSKHIGNMIINNTGDAQYANNNCTLDFRLSYNLPEGRAFYDGEYLKNFRSYTLAAKASQNISLNATFGLEFRQENLIITTEEVRLRSIYRYLNTTAILVSNQNGPYLYEKITSSPNVVYLTPGEFSLQGYFRNLMGSTVTNENNTAYNVSFYWALPSGLTNVSGASNIDYSNVTDNNLNYINANLSFISLADFSPGAKVISLKVYGYNLDGGLIVDANNNSLLTESANISFVCYNVSDGVYVTACGSADGDYLAPTISETTTTSSGGGGGGGAGEGGGGGSKFITETSRFELTRGKQNSFTVEFRNPFAVGEIKDLKISLTGLLSEYITISPSELSSLAAGETLKITSEITAPKYFNEGKYNLTMIITGTQTANQSTSEVNERKVITLYIFDISSADAVRYIDNSDKYLLDMKSKNWSVREVEGLLNDIRTAYNSTSLDIVNAKYAQLKGLYDKAVQSDLLIKALREEMNNSKLDGISTPETNKLVNLAESAFLRGDYNLAMDRLKEAQLSFALETKGEFSLVYYVKRHPTNTAGIVLATLVFVTGTSLLVRKRLLKSKLKLLGEEETLLLGLMKVIQKQCFEDAKMSMDEYQNAMAQYESRLNSVIQDKIETQSRLLNLMRIRGGRKKALNEESARLKDLIRETQKMYFEQNKIETRVYNNMMKSYAAKLSEIEEKLATLEAREALSKAGFRGGIKI